MLTHHAVSTADLDLLAQWNHELIEDEGHRNPMTVPQLKARMHSFIAGEYDALLFLMDNRPVAYALYRERDTEIYLRQFFVDREHRRQGIGRQAFSLLRSEIWPTGKRLTVDVLLKNEAAVQFWRSVGYRDYALTLEILPSPTTRKQRNTTRD